MKNANLVHENGSKCDGGSSCIDKPHIRVTAPINKTLTTSPTIVERQLLGLSSALTILRQVAVSKETVMAIKLATVLTHGAYLVLQTSRESNGDMVQVKETVLSVTKKLSELMGLA